MHLRQLMVHARQRRQALDQLVQNRLGKAVGRVADRRLLAEDLDFFDFLKRIYLPVLERDP